MESVTEAQHQSRTQNFKKPSPWKEEKGPGISRANPAPKGTSRAKMKGKLN